MFLPYVYHVHSMNTISLQFKRYLKHKHMSYTHTQMIYLIYVVFSLLISVILFCLAAVIFPIGFDMDQIGGEAYQLPNNFRVGISYIFFVLALWITVVSQLFASKVCLPHF